MPSFADSFWSSDYAAGTFTEAPTCLDSGPRS